jgi:hypothetical protein
MPFKPNNFGFDSIKTSKCLEAIAPEVYMLSGWLGSSDILRPPFSLRPPVIT